MFARKRRDNLPGAKRAAAAEDELEEPEFPAKSMAELLTLGFKRRTAPPCAIPERSGWASVSWTPYRRRQPSCARAMTKAAGMSFIV
jgi:hypothetical protein